MSPAGLVLAFILMAQIAHAEIVISNSSTVRSSTSASASTGGNEVDAGGSIETGDARASATSKVTGNGTTTVETRTESVVNGVSKVEEKIVTIPKGQTATVSASSSAQSGGETKQAEHASVPDAIESTPPANDSPAIEARHASSLFGRLSSFVVELLSGFARLAWWR